MRTRRVQQQFDMVALLNREIDAAQAMTYNEYAQVLEAVNPETGELYTEEDFVTIDWNDVGTAMLQDAVWASTERLESDPDYEDLTVRFLTATFQGWIHCRDNPEECRDIVVAAGSQLGNSHQLWQVNEVGKLIWPSPAGIGIIDQAAWALGEVDTWRGLRADRGDPRGGRRVTPEPPFCGSSCVSPSRTELPPNGGVRPRVGCAALAPLGRTSNGQR